MAEISEDLTPSQIVAELDKYIVGQKNAKRAVAVALRNRYRRRLLSDDLRDEVIPKNILMIGPTGVGKTEIARRLASLAHAPFIKVEATKFTEVGYVGRDVDSMIRDLVQVAIRLVETEKVAEVQAVAEERAVNRIVHILQPDRPASARGKRTADAEPQDMARHLRDVWSQMFPNAGASGGPIVVDMSGARDVRPEPPAVTEEKPVNSDADDEEAKDAARRERIRERLRTQVTNGALDEQELEISVEENQGVPFMQVFSNQGMDEMSMDMQNALGGLMPRKQKKRKVNIGEAKKIFTQEEAQNLIDRDSLTREAITRTEQSGIIFVDEIDKIAGNGRGPGGGSGPDVSREGVQRDILPIIEGSTVNTKFGPVKTDHILFIAAGAFHVSKPSDLIPELQGRLPIRVELENLTEADFQRILTEPRNALTRQYSALLATEGVNVDFTDDAIVELARIAAEVNRRSENIGARRLHTILERLLEDVSFDAPDMPDKQVHVDAAYVRSRLDDIVKDEDLSRYIL
jgi:ATP-dependent HslUV protease ATP-binding subunit HslU